MYLESDLICSSGTPNSLRTFLAFFIESLRKSASVPVTAVFGRGFGGCIGLGVPVVPAAAIPGTVAIFPGVGVVAPPGEGATGVWKRLGR